MPVPIAVVGNEGTVNSDVVPELLNGLVQLAAVLKGSAVNFEILFQQLNDLQCAADIAVPQVPLQPLEALRYIGSINSFIRFVAVGRQGFLVRSSQFCREPLDVLPHHGQAHREVEPVQPMLRLRTQVHLQVTNGVSSIRQEHQLLIRLQPL